MRVLFAIFLLGLAPHAFSSQMPEHVKNLGGCFTVSYRFVENGKNDYEIPKALEWITVKTEGSGYRVQHYGLFEDPQTKETEVMKHFYEDWTEGANGVWEQKVFGPSGKYRYTCASAVRFGQLRCQSPRAPKPLRHTKRKEYDVLNRETMLQVTPKGWVQSEVNDLIKNDGTLVATELGWIEYRRIDEKACEEAKKQHPVE